MVAVVVLTDEYTGCQALYVDGVLKYEDDTIFACDIAAHTKNQQMTFEHDFVYLPDDGKWPDRYDEAIGFKYPIKDD